MADQVLYNVMIKSLYGYLKHKLVISGSAKKFSDVFAETVHDISKKYNISENDLKAFFDSDEFKEHLETHLEDMDLDYTHLAEIIPDFIILDSDYKPEVLLREFINKMQTKLLKHPILKEQLTVQYFNAINMILVISLRITK